jgi:hypothetical protein
MTKTLILSMLALALWAGEAADKLPASIQNAINKAEQEVARNRAAYDKANEKPLAAAEKAIQAELDKLTKAGKLEEALAAKKALEGLRESVVAKVDSGAKEKTDLLGKPRELVDLVPGMWELHRDPKANDAALWVCEFFADGTMNGPKAGAGKWVLNGTTLVCNWTKFSHTYTMTDKQIIAGMDGLANVVSYLKKVENKVKK